MEEREVRNLLNTLRQMHAETEVVEFKEAKNTFDFTKIGKYFSALSNEANLKRKDCAWLVFGIENTRHGIVGTKFRPLRKDLDSLKGEIANKTTNRITFVEIYEVPEPEGRVLLFQIPAAPRGMPIAFEGFYFGRDGEELGPLNLEEIERIRSQTISEDWSAGIISSAKITDLDEEAIQFARKNYKVKFPELTPEVDSWTDETFLNKAKLTIKGKITRTAIILLGKEESEHFLLPAEAKIRWVLKDNHGTERDYQIFGCPILLSVSKVFSRIRNLKYRYITDSSLFPEEVQQYEPFTIREALSNCIAHQDYTKLGRVNVVEMEDRLIFTNLGQFIPVTVERVVMDDAPEEHYRNRFLVNAMFNLNMVDSIGGGIRKMFNYQLARFFPLPEYQFEGNRVQVTIDGRVLDMDFARLLARNKALSLEDIIFLDKVQKKKPLSPEEEKILKSKKLIEGRKPNYIFSSMLAQSVNQKAKYTNEKGFDTQYYLDLILKAIKEHGSMERKEVDQLLWFKLPDRMDDKQKKTRINHLLTELRSKGIIKNFGTVTRPSWRMAQVEALEPKGARNRKRSEPK